MAPKNHPSESFDHSTRLQPLPTSTPKRCQILLVLKSNQTSKSTSKLSSQQPPYIIALNQHSINLMERTFKSLVHESNLNSLNEQTTKFAQSIKSLLSNMVLNLRHQNQQQQNFETNDDMNSTSNSTDSHIDHLSLNSLNANQSLQLTPTTTTSGDSTSKLCVDTNDHNSDWPESFIQLLETLTKKQQRQQQNEHTNNAIECGDNRRPSICSPTSSLAIDDRDFELTVLQLDCNDSNTNYDVLTNSPKIASPNFDKTSLWLMDFNYLNHHQQQPQSLLELALNPLDNGDHNHVLPLEWDNQIDCCPIDDNNNIDRNINANDDFDQHDRNIVNLMKFVLDTKSTKPKSLLYPMDQSLNANDKNTDTNNHHKLLRRNKTLPLRFNYVTSVVDIDQLKQPIILKTKLDNTPTLNLQQQQPTESISITQDFEDEDQQDDRSNIKLTGHTNSNQTSNQEQAAARESIYSSSSTSNASSPRQGDKVDRGGDSYSSAQQSPAAAAEATKLDSNRVIGPQQPVDQQQQQQQNKQEDGKYSMLQFALYNFREAIEKYSLESKVQKVSPQVAGDTSTLRGSLKLIESLRNGTGSSIDQQPGDTNTNTSKSSKSNRKSSNASLLSAQQTSQLASTSGDWTWRELAEMVKFTRVPLKHSLLRLPSDDLNKRAIECFHAIMQYMGDNCLQQTSGGLGSKSSVPPPQNDVDCVYLILMNCHNFPHLRDEVYCQLIKQTTNNRSDNGDSCLKGWRLFSIVAAYFDCSDSFKPYLLKYLETAAYDKRRAYCSVALLCLQNLRKTFKFGGRKNVPSIEEIAATSAGRNSKRQIYRLPGGTERVINTKSTTVVDDIIYEICSNMLDVTNQDEMLEFSLYCIADGDLYTMPLNRDEYILDVTTELIKNHQQYFLIFCRSIWYYPLRLDSKLYIEVIFNQIAPDYLEGLFLVLPNLRTRRNGQLSPLKLKSRQVKEIARIAALLHRASGTDYLPQKDEIKYLLPRTIVSAMRQQQRIAQQQQQTGTNSGHSPRSPGQTSSDMFDSYEFGDSYESSSNSNQQQQPLAEEEPGETNGPLDSIVMAPQKWIELVQNNWRDMTAFDTLDAKAQFLNIIRHWPLFGSSFFAIKLFQRDLIQPTDFILALNKFGIQMLDILTHETKHKYPFNEIISTRKVRSEDGALYLDLKCGNLMKRTIIRIQTDQAHEISRLIRHYIDIELLNSNSDRTLQLHNQQQ